MPRIYCCNIQRLHSIAHRSQGSLKSLSINMYYIFTPNFDWGHIHEPFSVLKRVEDARGWSKSVSFNALGLERREICTGSCTQRTSENASSLLLCKSNPRRRPIFAGTTTALIQIKEVNLWLQLRSVAGIHLLEVQWMIN